jgi:hypothetical protein
LFFILKILLTLTLFCQIVSGRCGSCEFEHRQMTDGWVNSFVRVEAGADRLKPPLVGAPERKPQELVALLAAA